MTQVCDWSAPGSSPYTGTVVEWVARLPADLRPRITALVERIERHDFDAVVYADSDRVFDASGSDAYAYEPRIDYMAFGRDRICRTTTRRWAAHRIESAMAWCDPLSNACVVRWSVCGNYSIVYRRPAGRAHALAIAPAETEALTLPPASPAGPPAAYVGGAVPLASSAYVEAVPSFGGGYAGGSFAAWGGGLYATTVVVECAACCVQAGPIAAIPEPTMWAQLVLGLVALGFAVGRGGR